MSLPHIQVKNKAILDKTFSESHKELYLSAEKYINKFNLIGHPTELVNNAYLRIASAKKEGVKITPEYLRKMIYLEARTLFRQQDRLLQHRTTCNFNDEQLPVEIINAIAQQPFEDSRTGLLRNLVELLMTSLNEGKVNFLVDYFGLLDCHKLTWKQLAKQYHISRRDIIKTLGKIIKILKENIPSYVVSIYDTEAIQFYLIQLKRQLYI